MLTHIYVQADANDNRENSAMQVSEFNYEGIHLTLDVCVSGGM